jgi:hypothetical protein
MKYLLKHGIIAFFAVLVIANVGIFLSGVNLGGKINHYEIEIKKLHEENIDLEKQVVAQESLSNAASQAAELSFTRTTTPLRLESTRYALNR